MSTKSQGYGKSTESLVSDGVELVQATLVNLTPQTINPRPSSSIPINTRIPKTEQISVHKTPEPTPPIDTAIDQSYDTNPGESHSTDDSKIEDSTWRKLKNIFRKHQEKDTQKTLINKPEGHTTNTVQMKSEGNDISREPKSDSTDGQVSSSGPEVLYSDASSEPLDQPEFRDNQLDERQYRKPHTVKPDPEIPVIHSYDQQDPEITDIPRSINPEAFAENSQNQEEKSEDLTPHEKLGHIESQSKPELNSDPKLHEIPLEAAWPVQKKKLKPIQKSDNSQRVDPSFEKSEIQDIQSDNQTAIGVKTIQRALKNVVPGQPTSSSIEIITPRRPRPHFSDQRSKTSNSIKPDVQKTFTAPVNEHAQLIHKKPSPKPNRQVADELSGRDQDLKELPEKTELGTLPLDRPSKGHPYQPQLNRVQDAGGSSSEDQINMDELGSDPETELVQTDIGELPVDLWHILNQDAPTTTTGEDIKTESQPTNISRGSPVMRETRLQEGRTDSPVSTKVVEPKIPQSEGSSIQRTIATNDHRDVPSSTSTTESTDEINPDDDNSQSWEPDINELSAHVYAEIKRRLMVEWERKRNRNL
jgi:hypothetical protein